MPTSASLSDLIDALEEQSDSIFSYLDRETGEVVLMSEESLSLSECEPEEINSLPDWQKEEAHLAIQIETTDRYLALPDRFEVNEWSIMRDFCDQVKPDHVRGTLQKSIHGNHAFRRFKDQIASLNLWNSWNQFRRNALEEILLPWCEENDIILLTGATRAGKPQSG